MHVLKINSLNSNLGHEIPEVFALVQKQNEAKQSLLASPVQLLI